MAPDAGVRIAPGGCIGILGDGQLGRMLVLAAARLGYRCHIFGPDRGSPAGQVAAQTVADYLDEAALERFAAAVDVVTTEFENVPAATLARLAAKVPVRPGAAALETAQDRRLEKSFFNFIGAATAPWWAIDDLADLEAGLAAIGRPAILKSSRFGYDGKGQERIAPGDDAAAVYRAIGRVPAILEGFVDFEREISVIVARGLDGGTACFDVVENRHRNHILHVTRAPAPIPTGLAAEARAIAERAAAELGLVGLLAVEMFVTRDGRLLVNEMAPRPHNSGHWTIDACVTSQFEQCVRAVCGQPLGDPSRFADAEMTNLIGDDARAWPVLMAEPGARLHLYGKAEIRPGRKMGHVTRVRPLAGPG